MSLTRSAWSLLNSMPRGIWLPPFMVEMTAAEYEVFRVVLAVEMDYHLYGKGAVLIPWKHCKVNGLKLR